MVRTYAFNPSTQSLSDGLPCAKADITSMKMISNVPYSQQFNSKSCVDPNISPDDDDAITADGKNRVARLLPTFAKSIVRSNSIRSVAPTVIEDATTVLGIRCLRIEGQRFYQPIDIVEQQKNENNTGNFYNNQAKSSEYCVDERQNLFPGNQQFSLEESRKRNVEDTDSCSQDSGYQCSQTTSSTCFGEKLGSSEATGEKVSLYAPKNQNQQEVILTTISLFKEPSNESNVSLAINNASNGPKKWRNEVFSPSQNISHHKSDFELAKQVQHNPMAASSDTTPFTYGSFYVDPSYYARSTLNLAQLGATAEQRERFAKEQHKLDLLRQIEDNKHRKMLEKQREWEAEERERVKNELYQQRIRLELEEERRKEREKQILAERKLQKIASAQKEAARRLEQAQRDAQEKRARDASAKRQREESDDEAGHRPEANSAKRPRSPVIPTLRSKLNENYGNENLENLNVEKNETEIEEEIEMRHYNPADERRLSYTKKQRESSFNGNRENKNLKKELNSYNRSDYRGLNDFSDKFSYDKEINNNENCYDNYCKTTKSPLSYKFQRGGDIIEVERHQNSNFNKRNCASLRSRSSSNFSSYSEGSSTQPAIHRRKEGIHGFDSTLNEADDRSESYYKFHPVRERKNDRGTRSCSRGKRRSYKSSLEDNVTTNSRKTIEEPNYWDGLVRADSASLHRLDGTHQRLRREEERVRAALRARNYGAHLFDEDVD